MNGNIGTRLIFNQILDVLPHLEGAIYRQSLALFSGASFGQHFRHIFEFYECLVNGVQSGQIDYANRKRNPFVENDVNAAIAAFQSLKNPIAALDEGKLISIVSEYSNTEEENRMIVQSSIGRELMYAYDHAIHHLAIIKMGMQVECPEVKLPANLGVAPSTVKHREAAAR